MGLIAERLTEAALAEIALRDPDFLSRQPLAPLSPADIVAAHPGHPLAADSAIERRLAARLSQLEQLGVRFDPQHGAQPHLGGMLAASVLDAEAADAGLIDLRPLGPARIDGDNAPAVREAGGARWIAAGDGPKVLVLINAVGLPLELFARVLAAPPAGARVIAVEPAAGRLFEGGFRGDAGLGPDVDHIERALQAEGADRFTVVGWCSGGRVALDLAARRGEAVDQLVLISPSLRGAAPDEDAPTQFEQDGRQVFDSVERSPASAGFLSAMLVRAQGAAPAPADDLSLFRLPDRAHGQALAVPFADADALQRYAARLAADRGHDTLGALARVSAPILAVTGAHDHIVSNAATLRVLRRAQSPVTAVEVSGAGHYAHDLQYAYVRAILEAVVARAALPDAARLKLIGD